MTTELAHFIQIAASSYFWVFLSLFSLISLKKIFAQPADDLKEHKNEEAQIKKGKYRPYKNSITSIIGWTVWIISMYYK